MLALLRARAVRKKKATVFQIKNTAEGRGPDKEWTCPPVEGLSTILPKDLSLVRAQWLRLQVCLPSFVGEGRVSVHCGEGSRLAP